MTFQPVIPFGGFAGWAFLKRTMTTQQAALQASSTNQRDEAYFREKIGKIETADDLVSDRRLLRVALTAYGLEGDINNKAFIRKVLEDGTLKEGALSGRLANKQYEKFSAAFGFGDFSVPRSQLSDFADKTLALYQARQFESAVGEQNNGFRLALNTERELGSLAAKSGSEDTKWFTVMGNAPLRQTFQTALGLPSSFASIDLDQQLSVLKSRAESLFGDDSISQFTDPDKMTKLVRTYLARSEISNIASPTASASVALQLLRGG
ncbi:MAG: DUF1217 domain-containing protein [Paracoccaceae bacterium]